MFCKVKTLNDDHIVELLKAGVLYHKVKKKDGMFQFKYKEYKIPPEKKSWDFDVGEPEVTILWIKHELKNGNVYIKVGDA